MMLKPCPFCQNKVWLYERNKGRRDVLSIECSPCHLAMSSRAYLRGDEQEKESALMWLVANWNRMIKSND